MILLLALSACRPDPGAPDYPEPGPWVIGGDDDDFYDDPFDPGETRLSLGLFYEGDATETVVIDDTTSHFYVYSNTFTDSATDDRWEGYVADVLTNNGVGWWGGGVHWDSPRDLSAWDSLHVVIRSDVLADWDVGMTGGGVEVRIPVADLGFVADDEWHELEVPLADFADGGLDLTSITVALLLVGESGAQGDEIYVDGVYVRGSE